MANAILRYPGAKWRIADWILEHMPPHAVYCEPYFGSGAVFFSKAPVKHETINDINGDVVNFFRICRERPEELAALLELTPYAREEYKESYQEVTDPLEKARRLAVRCWMAQGARQGESNGWRYSANSSGPVVAQQWTRMPEKVIQIACRLQYAQIDNRPALEVIARHNKSDCLIYADPPYLMHTRTGGKQYSYEMDEQEHVALLQTLLKHTGPVLLSGYDSDLYNDMLSGWGVAMKETRSDRGGTRTEVLWINQAADMRLLAREMQS